MNILHFCPLSPLETGGLQIYIAKLTNYLNKNGFPSEILSTNREIKHNYVDYIGNTKINFIKTFSHNFPFSFLNKDNPFVNVFPFILKNQDKYDLFHIHSYNFILSLQSILMSKIFKKPSILTLHGTVEMFFLKDIPFILRLKLIFISFYYRLIGKFVIENCDALIGCSKKDLLLIGKAFFSRRKSRNYWIPNGIEINTTDIKKLERKYITFIGRLEYLKGFNLFLEIMKAVNLYYPSIPILIIGKGPLKLLIKKEYSFLNITYIPHISNEKINEYYLKSKILLQCSYSEATPTTILEAMANKTPVISSNVGGVSELIEDGFNGYLFDTNNSKEAVEKILKILSNRNLTEKFSERSYNIVKNKFTWSNIIRKHKKVYQSVLTLKK